MSRKSKFQLFAITAMMTLVGAGFCFSAGCTRNNGSAATGSAPTGQLASAAQISDQPTGVFKATGLVSSSPITERFQRGCLNPGEDDPAFANIDLRLKVGQKFQTRIQTGSPGETMDYLSSGTITKVDDTHSVLSGRLSISPGTTGAEIATIFNTTCTVTNVADGSAAQQSVSCVADSALDNPKHQNCRVEQVSPVISEVKGIYQFASGAKANAYKVTHESTGTVYCETAGGAETSMGPGREVTVTIVSNEVVSVAPRDCGGNIISSYHAVSIDSGQLEAVEKNEQLEMPIDPD